MEVSHLLLSFIGIKVALALSFWYSINRGLELGARIEARKRAEAAAAAAAAANEAVDDEPVVLPTPADDTPAAA